MRTATCECGHQEVGATEKDALTKIRSHMQSEHPEKASDMEKMMKAAEASLSEEEVASM